MHRQLQYILSEFGFGAILTALTVISIRDIKVNKVSYLLLFLAAILPLQRYIGLATANVALVFTCLFLNKPLKEKFHTWLQSATIINIPILLFALSNYFVIGSYFGPRNTDSEFSVLENIRKVLTTFGSEFTIETVGIVFSLGICCFILWKHFSLSETPKRTLLSNPIEVHELDDKTTIRNLLILLTSILLISHVVTQIYSSSTVSINPIGPRYFIPFETLFLVQIIATFLFLGGLSQTTGFSWIARLWCLLLLLSFPISTYNSLPPLQKSFGENPREFGSRHHNQLSNIVSSINEYQQDKKIAIYELGKPHMPIFYLEMGIFDVLSPGCKGIQLLSTNITHYDRITIAKPDCQSGVESSTRFYLMREIESDPQYSHIIISRNRISGNDIPNIISNIEKKGFTIVGSQKSFLLFERNG
jgi:hypothetical protein